MGISERLEAEPTRAKSGPADVTDALLAAIPPEDRDVLLNLMAEGRNRPTPAIWRAIKAEYGDDYLIPAENTLHQWRRRRGYYD